MSEVKKFLLGIFVGGVVGVALAVPTYLFVVD